MLYVLVAGGPCTGKTTLVRLLSGVLGAQGLRIYVIRDWAREIIKEGKDGKEVPLPWTDRAAFETEVVRRHISDFRRAQKYSPDIIIEDSGPIAPIAYCRVDSVELPKDIVRNIMTHVRRLNLIVITEPLTSYNTDNERWEEREYAMKLHKEIVRVHRNIAINYGINIIRVPPSYEPTARVSHVIKYLLPYVSSDIKIKVM